jgi:hypothetical protein
MYTRRTLAVAASVAAVLGVPAHLLFFRRRLLNWGAREDEVAATLPGDDLLADAGLVTTRAITVDAPPEDIWPWLVQMGSGRGGAYSYDWIENLLGLDMHSATEILPEYQDLKVGDELPMGQGRPVMRVEVLDRPRAMAIRVADQNWAWIFALLPERKSTRLISRNRIATEALSPASRLFYLLAMEPGSLVMERKMLLGIKRRAEAGAEPVGNPRGDAGPVGCHRTARTLASTRGPGRVSGWEVVADLGEHEMTLPTDHAGLEVLPFDSCLSLLAAASVGRVGFVAGGEVLVLPVNFVVDGQDMVFRTASGSKLASAEVATAVAFEADNYDDIAQSGWSVLVSGRAEVVEDDAEIGRLSQLGLHSWASALDRPFWIRIRPTSVTGRRTPGS